MAERGQAAVELVAGTALLLAVALLCMQLLATGYAATLADGAVAAGATAAAAGLPAEPAARAALPGWAAERVEVDRRGGRIAVRLRPPSPFSALERALEVSSSAWVRPAGGG